MKARLALGVLISLVAVVGTSRLVESQADADHHKLGAQIFELRTYTTAEGKLDHLHARFRNHTNHLFVKHGMRLVAYWIPTEKADTLIYVLAHENRDAAKKSWAAFIGDPAWKKVYKASHEKAGGRIVTKVESVFMNPTDYSPIR